MPNSDNAEETSDTWEPPVPDPSRPVRLIAPVHRRPSLSREARRRANDAANVARRQLVHDTEASESSGSEIEPLPVGRDVHLPPRNAILYTRLKILIIDIPNNNINIRNIRYSV